MTVGVSVSFLLRLEFVESEMLSELDLLFTCFLHLRDVRDGECLLGVCGVESDGWKLLIKLGGRVGITFMMWQCGPV